MPLRAQLRLASRLGAKEELSRKAPQAGMNLRPRLPDRANRSSNSMQLLSRPAAINRGLQHPVLFMSRGGASHNADNTISLPAVTFANPRLVFRRAGWGKLQSRGFRQSQPLAL